MTLNEQIKTLLPPKNLRLHIAILAIFHLVGIIGFSTKWRSLFLLLTPFHLLLVFGYLTVFQQKIDKRFLTMMFVVVFSSYLIELLGVQTGMIFGSYQYGEALGFKIGGTPFLIGVLWFVLVYSIRSQLIGLKIHWFLKGAVGAAMMLLIDLFIEPVAIELGFWSWENNAIPVKNYLAWFTISLIYFILFSKPAIPKNRLAPYVYWMQLGFFVVINILLHLGLPGQ
jgi:putative membrane protein